MALKTAPFGQNIADAIYALTNVINGGEDSVIYGIRIDGAESNPSARVTYVKDAIGMTPAGMNYQTSTFSYGTWADTFFMPRPCMLRFDGNVDYYLNPNDYTKRESGIASDVANIEYGGNAMMEWGRDGKKIWWCIVPDETTSNGSYFFYVANYKANSNFHCYNHYNKNDVAMPHFYTPIYRGTLDTSNRLRSISGQAIMHSKSGTQEIEYAKANGEGWNIDCFADFELIWHLCYLIGKSTDLQGVFGLGHCNGGSSASSLVAGGTLNNKGLFWGSTDGTGKVKVFGMEDVWGEQWRRLNGLILDNNIYKFKLTEGIADGSTRNGYPTTDSEGMLDGGTCNINSGNYVTKNRVIDKKVALPDVGGGGSSTYFCDYFYKNVEGVRFALVGGHSRDGLLCGAYVSLNHAVSNAWWAFGASPSCKPLE